MNRLLLAAATCLIGVSASDLDWWQRGSMYQIYPRSFKDSTGSGTGDIDGIRRNLDYLVDLGVGYVWLSPVLESPMKDFGYDISNYRRVDPLFGTMDDLDRLLKEMHNKGLKLLMDFVPNHTSEDHE